MATDSYEQIKVYMRKTKLEAIVPIKTKIKKWKKKSFANLSENIMGRAE